MQSNQHFVLKTKEVQQKIITISLFILLLIASLVFCFYSVEYSISNIMYILIYDNMVSMK